MFSQPGIGIEDLPWIHRDQFVHYVELARALGDLHNWSCFRGDLLRALTAAFGLDPGNVNGDRLRTHEHHVLEVLEGVRCKHDPSTDWLGFSELLWSRRHAIRPDLP
jgi:hypothetical protein